MATVKNHLHNAFAKLRIKNRREVLVRLRNEPWLAAIAPERLRAS
nr:response regulator transcription factor [Gammaproteobacteria bacterium]